MPKKIATIQPVKPSVKTPPKKPSASKKPLIILLVLLLIGGLYLAKQFFTTQTNKTNAPIKEQEQYPNNSSNTYVNNEAGVRIQFPNNWDVPSEGKGSMFQLAKDPNSNGVPPIISVEKKATQSLATVASDCNWIVDSGNAFRKKSMNIDGHNATYLENIKTNIFLNDELAYYACIAVEGNPGYLIVWHNDTKEPGDITNILQNMKLSK